MKTIDKAKLLIWLDNFTDNHLYGDSYSTARTIYKEIQSGRFDIKEGSENE